MRKISNWFIAYLVFNIPFVLILGISSLGLYEIFPSGVTTYMGYYAILAFIPVMLFFTFMNSAFNRDIENRRLLATLSILSYVGWASFVGYYLINEGLV